GGDERVIQSVTRLVRLLVNKFAAHPVPGRQIADRCRPRQRLNGQVLAVTPWHCRRRPNASIHLAPPLKKVRVSPSAPGLVNPVECDLGLNQAPGYPGPPAQIPACGFPAPGSCRRSDATEVRGLGGPCTSDP